MIAGTMARICEVWMSDGNLTSTSIGWAVKIAKERKLGWRTVYNRIVAWPAGAKRYGYDLVRVPPPSLQEQAIMRSVCHHAWVRSSCRRCGQYCAHTYVDRRCSRCGAAKRGRRVISKTLAG